MAPSLADHLPAVQLGATTEQLRPSPPQEARRLTERFEFHYTPKHGSWLNIAEIELSVLARQCLKRRIPDHETLEREVAAWVADRNAATTRIDWRFTTADARIKLQHLYPSL